MPTEVINRDDKFGISNTYNPYTNSMSLANVANQRFKIPLTSTFANASVVVVSTGLVPRIESVLNGDMVFNLYEEDNQTLIQQLIPKVVDVGSGQYPARNEINWFDIIGMQGDFMVHSDWCGKILEISGKIETCSITAEDINGINKNIKDNYNDLIDKINRIGERIKLVEMSKQTISNGRRNVRVPNWLVGYISAIVIAGASINTNCKFISGGGNIQMSAYGGQDIYCENPGGGSGMGGIGERCTYTYYADASISGAISVSASSSSSSIAHASVSGGGFIIEEGKYPKK